MNLIPYNFTKNGVRMSYLQKYTRNSYVFDTRNQNQQLIAIATFYRNLNAFTTEASLSLDILSAIFFLKFK